MADFLNMCKCCQTRRNLKTMANDVYAYKAGQHTTYGDSQYSTVYVDASSQGWSVGTQYTVKAGQPMLNSIRYLLPVDVSQYLHNCYDT